MKMSSSQEIGNSVVIVGSGVAGSVLATVLAREGRHVTVIERLKVPQERLNGEGMQPGGMDALRELGLEECAGEADGVVFTGIAMCEEATGREAILPFPQGAKGVLFKNHLFVQALRKRVMEEKRCNFIEASVEDLIEEDGTIKGVMYRRKNTEKNEELRADLTFLCEGVYSKFRKVNVTEKPVKHGTQVGFMYDSSLEDPEQLLQLFLGPKNATITYNVNKDEKRTMCYIRGDWPSNLTEHIKNQIKYVPDDLAAQMLVDIENKNFGKVHTFQLRTKAEFHPGVITIGDALNIRHPVTAAGMTVAFKDIIIWRDLLRQIPDLGDVEAMCAAHRTFLSNRRAYSFVVNLNAKVFSDITYPLDDEGEFRRDCLFEYLLWSEKARRDLGAITAVKETRSRILLYHLTMATLFNTNCTLWESGWSGLPVGLFKAAKSLYSQSTTLWSLIMHEYHSS